MSEKLIYKIPPRKIPVGNVQLKSIIQKRFVLPVKIWSDEVKYFQALQDMGVEGAVEIINALHKYEEIILDIEG